MHSDKIKLGRFAMHLYFADDSKRSLFIGLILSAYLTTIKLAFNLPLRDRPLLLLAILLIIFGVQLITIGTIGELAIRNYYESQNK